MNFKQPLSDEIFFRKYALHGETSVEEVLNGVAEEIASVEKEEDREHYRGVFYNSMITGEFIPAGRILANARPDSRMKNYNNCFTIDIEDSMEGIYDSLKEDALIGKVGGGVGFNASKLRPRGAIISKGGESSGVMSFAEVFDTSAKAICTGGGRRCLPEGTSVHSKTGMKSIEDIKIGDKVLTSEGYERVSNFFDQGEQETIVIHTAINDFECTPNHKMAVFDGLFSYTWKEAKDLKNGDKLVFVNKLIEGQPTQFPAFYYEKPEHSTTTVDITIPPLDGDSAWLLGLIFGDGFVWTNDINTKGGVSIACDNIYPKIIERAKKELEKFGVNVFVKSGDGACTNVISYSNQLGIFFGQFKKPKETLVIPDFIMNGSVEIRSSFIAGVFDADGSCRTKPLEVVSTVYKEFAEQVKYLLLSLGIPTVEYVLDRSNDGWQTLYSVGIPNAVGVRSWDKLIALLSEKYVSKRKSKGFYQSGNNDFGWTREMFLEEEIKPKSIWSKQSKNIKLTTLERLIDREIDLYPVDFLGISEGRMIQTYDIEVENRHEFVAEGFLTHNSAHIMILNVDHPDIEEFILYKKGRENNALTQFNISVGITNKFMNAVENDLDWDLVFEGKVYKTLRAKDLFETMTKQAWWYNEPGVLFLDSVEEDNNAPHAFKVDRCNPCGR